MLSSPGWLRCTVPILDFNNPWGNTMPKFKHPGVFIQEIPSINTNIVAVPTAVPAFIGYTQSAARQKDGDLHLTPTRITSFEEYCRLFGQSEAEPLHLELTSTPGAIVLKKYIASIAPADDVVCHQAVF